MLLPSLLALLALPALAVAAPAPFQNTALVRTIDLGGATSLVTTTYTAKSVSSKLESTYELLVGRAEWEAKGWFDVREKKARSAAAAAGRDDTGLTWTVGAYDVSL
jgi:oligosaccharyltransferase complex subunit alpha (ribophorin I)